MWLAASYFSCCSLTACTVSEVAYGGLRRKPCKFHRSLIHLIAALVLLITGPVQVGRQGYMPQGLEDSAEGQIGTGLPLPREPDGPVGPVPRLHRRTHRQLAGPVQRDKSFMTTSLNRASQPLRARMPAPGKSIETWTSIANLSTQVIHGGGDTAQDDMPSTGGDLTWPQEWCPRSGACPRACSATPPGRSPPAGPPPGRAKATAARGTAPVLGRVLMVNARVVMLMRHRL
jgi:hypothetical protein